MTVAQEKAQRNEDFDDGELVIDASGNVAQKTLYGEGGWFVMGWTDEPHPFDMLTQPVRRLVQASGSGTTIYRITRKGGDVKVGPPQRLAGILGAARQSMYRSITRIERAVIDDSQFEDITGQYKGDPGVEGG